MLQLAESGAHAWMSPKTMLRATAFSLRGCPLYYIALYLFSHLSLHSYLLMHSHLAAEIIQDGLAAERTAEQLGPLLSCWLSCRTAIVEGPEVFHCGVPPPFLSLKVGGPETHPCTMAWAQSWD